jgi:hypothetical protein
LVLLVVEVSTTMMGGVWAMVAPMDFVPNMTGLVPGAAAPELSRLRCDVEGHRDCASAPGAYPCEFRSARRGSGRTIGSWPDRLSCRY